MAGQGSVELDPLHPSQRTGLITCVVDHHRDPQLFQFLHDFRSVGDHRILNGKAASAREQKFIVRRAVFARIQYSTAAQGIAHPVHIPAVFFQAAVSHRIQCTGCLQQIGRGTCHQIDLAGRLLKHDDAIIQHFRGFHALGDHQDPGILRQGQHPIAAFVLIDTETACVLQFKPLLEDHSLHFLNFLRDKTGCLCHRRHLLFLRAGSLRSICTGFSFTLCSQAVRCIICRCQAAAAEVQSVDDLMGLAHRSCICDDCHLLVKAGDRNTEFTVAALIYREILTPSDFHVIIVRTAPQNRCKDQIVFHGKGCRALNGSLAGPSCEGHVTAVGTVRNRVFHSPFRQRGCHEADLMIIPFLLTLAETGTLQRGVQCLHRDLISIGTFFILTILCIVRRIGFDCLGAGPHKQPQISFTAQCDDR